MSTLQQQLYQLNILYKNALAIISSYNEAIVSNEQLVEFTLTNLDGSTSIETVPTNTYLNRIVKSLENTVQELTTTTGQSTVSVSVADPNVREVYISTFERAIGKVTNYVVQSNIKIEQNPIIQKLTNPVTSVQVKLPTSLSHIQNARVYKLKLTGDDKDADLVNSGILASDGLQAAINKLESNGISYFPIDANYFTSMAKLRFFGTFSVLQFETLTNGNLRVQLNKRTYSDSLNSTTDSKELNTGDRLVTSDGRTQFEIVNISTVNGFFYELQKTGGFGTITAGIDALSYLDTNDIERFANVPMESNERSIVFVAPIDSRTGIAGEWSNSIILNSSEFTVEDDGITKTFDDYYNEKILPIGKYLESVVQDENVSRFQALDILKPTLELENFEVVQVNKHVGLTGDFDKIKKLQEEKNQIQSKITKLSNEIQTISARYSTGVYKSDIEAKRDLELLETKLKERNILSASFNSIVKDIATYGDVSSAAKATPKYRVRGFWKVDEPVSDDGQVQRVVKYEVQYKYTPSNSRASQTQSVSEIDGVSGTFSPWIPLKTEPLQKSFNEDTGKYEWEENNIKDSEQININQLDVPVTYGESVIIRVRAISEAGYPSNPAISEWSDLIRVEFPASLAQDETISAIVSQNNREVQLLELEQFLDNQGLLQHINKSFVEQSNYFGHLSSEIDAGYKNDDGTTQNQFQFNNTILNRISALNDLINRRVAGLSLEIVDSDSGRVSVIGNRKTVKVFAGNYTDFVDITDSGNFGSVVEKLFYLRISNNNAIDAEILTLSAGDLNARTSNLNYIDSPIVSNTDGTVRFQKNGQIFYLRKQDLAGSIELFREELSTVDTIVPAIDVDSGAPLASQDVVYYDGAALQVVALTTGASASGYAAILKTHPLYEAYLANPTATTLQAVIDEFDRIKNMTAIMRTEIAQRDIDSEQIVQYQNDDKFLVGAETCGAKLFVRPQSVESIQVDSSDSGSPFIVGSGSEILIPVVMQFRMTDAKGRLNGDGSKSLTGSNLTYTKKIGIDILNANEEIRFDLEVSCSFRPTINSGISSVDSTPINIPSGTDPKVL